MIAELIGQAQTDPEILADQLWGACYHRLLMPTLPLTEEFAANLVTSLMHGVRPSA
ncbi:hypothetical protein ACFYP6_13870 [Streptomyces goshikiensis]|uniref:hypothetical protein n=1 Tax=Streptomyces goshikiensis TaxID=1942 RepID=UPI0036919F48